MLFELPNPHDLISRQKNKNIYCNTFYVMLFIEVLGPSFIFVNNQHFDDALVISSSLALLKPEPVLLHTAVRKIKP